VEDHRVCPPFTFFYIFIWLIKAVRNKIMIANNNQTSQFTGKKISISQVRNGQGKETDKHAFISKV